MTAREQDYRYDPDGYLYFADLVLGETKDYQIDWSGRLTNEGDTLQTVTWTIPTGLIKEDESEIDGEVTVWLSATATGTYECKCQVDTLDSGATQTYLRVFYIKVI